MHIEPEQRVGAAGAVHLGSHQVVCYMKLPHGGMATTMAYDMEDFLKSFIQRYLEVAGKKVTLRN